MALMAISETAAARVRRQVITDEFLLNVQFQTDEA
jgi:hypothetical protein